MNVNVESCKALTFNLSLDPKTESLVLIITPGVSLTVLPNISSFLTFLFRAPSSIHPCLFPCYPSMPCFPRSPCPLILSSLPHVLEVRCTWKPFCRALFDMFDILGCYSVQLYIKHIPTVSCSVSRLVCVRVVFHERVHFGGLRQICLQRWLPRVCFWRSGFVSLTVSNVNLKCCHSTPKPLGVTLSSHSQSYILWLC